MTNETGARRFVRRYGLLGYRALAPSPRLEGEPVDWFLAHARTVRTLLGLVRALYERDPDRAGHELGQTEVALAPPLDKPAGEASGETIQEGHADLLVMMRVRNPRYSEGPPARRMAAYEIACGGRAGSSCSYR